MRSLAQNYRRDFIVTAGRIQTVSDLESAKIIIDNAVRSQLGEYRYNTTKGVNYEGNVFGPAPNLQLFEAQVRRNVLSLSFVERINSFEYNVSNNELVYEMSVSTIYGDTDTVTTEQEDQGSVIDVQPLLVATQKYVISGINYAVTFNGQ